MRKFMRKASWAEVSILILSNISLNVSCPSPRPASSPISVCMHTHRVLPSGVTSSDSSYSPMQGLKWGLQWEQTGVTQLLLPPQNRLAKEQFPVFSWLMGVDRIFSMKEIDWCVEKKWKLDSHSYCEFFFRHRLWQSTPKHVTLLFKSLSYILTQSSGFILEERFGKSQTLSFRLFLRL